MSITAKAGNTTYPGGPFNLVPGTPYTHPFPLKAEDIAGVTTPVKVTIAGSGQATFNVIATVAYVDHPFIVVTWDLPTLT